MPGEPMRLIIVTGLSGAGKSVALHALEDFGYYCIDNLPIGMLPEFLRRSRETDRALYHKVAVGMDARNPAEDLSRFPTLLRELASDAHKPELIFFEASDDILIKRFSETRRKHPLSSHRVSLSDAIRRERELLAPLSEHADLLIDTSQTHVHELRRLIRERVVQRQSQGLSLQFTSFGFKHGIPPEADFVFDLRCLPNPYWDANLRDHSGRDRAVINFLEGSDLVWQMRRDLCAFLDSWIPKFEAENRSYLTVALGCTGGHHRSVYLTEKLAAYYQAQGKEVLVRHRDL
ncbi:MAG: RNase adapter RapZ [Gammaproteobacteria bacterium]